jgi:hypothetical protein
MGPGIVLFERERKKTLFSWYKSSKKVSNSCCTENDFCNQFQLGNEHTNVKSAIFASFVLKMRVELIE